MTEDDNIKSTSENEEDQTGAVVTQDGTIENIKWYTKVENHLSKHQELYIGILIGVSVTALVVIATDKKKIINNIFNTNTPVATALGGAANALAEGGNAIAALGGRAHKVVKRLEDGKLFERVLDAAEEAGVSPSAMSKHINGHTDHVYGKHYAIVGLGTK